jgi:hypothetical protein
MTQKKKKNQSLITTAKRFHKASENTQEAVKRFIGNNNEINTKQEWINGLLGSDLNMFNTRKCVVCGNEAPKRCSKCKMAYYCCNDHQKEDWKIHKSCCPLAAKFYDFKNEAMSHSKYPMTFCVFFNVPERKLEKLTCWEDYINVRDELKCYNTEYDKLVISDKLTDSLSCYHAFLSTDLISKPDKKTLVIHIVDYSLEMRPQPIDEHITIRFGELFWLLTGNSGYKDIKIQYVNSNISNHGAETNDKYGWTYEMHQMEYSAFCTSMFYTKPDMIVLLAMEIPGTAEPDWFDIVESVKKQLLKTPIPTFCFVYSEKGYNDHRMVFEEGYHFRINNEQSGLNVMKPLVVMPEGYKMLNMKERYTGKNHYRIRIDSVDRSKSFLTTNVMTMIENILYLEHLQRVELGIEKQEM